MINKKFRRVGIVVMLGLVAIGLSYSSYPRTLFIERKGVGISTRGAEYLAKRSQADRSWSTVRLGAEKKAQTKILGSKTIGVGNCFTLTIPLSVRLIKNKEKCFSVFVADSPKGNIRAYEQKTNYTSVEEVSDVKMRRLYKDTYKEREVLKNGRSILVFEAEDPFLYDAVSFYLQNGRLIVVSMQFPTSENLDSTMDTIVSSIEVQ